MDNPQKTNQEKIAEFCDFTPMGDVFVMFAIQTYAASVAAQNNSGPIGALCADGLWVSIANKWLDARQAES